MRIVAISDLHLGVGRRLSFCDPPEGFVHDRQLSALIGQLSVDSAEPVCLLLLGDIFELPGGFVPGKRRPGYLKVEISDLLNRVARIAGAHPAVFTALAAFVEAGGTVEIVPGNHDPALAIPEVAEGLVEAIAAAGCAVHVVRDRLRIHPGAFHLPGELHAQHGNQFHDLNAFAAPAQPFRRGRRAGSVRLEDPLGSVLHRLQLAPRSWSGLREFPLEVVNVAVALPVLAFRTWRSSLQDDDPLAIALRPKFFSGTLAACWRVTRRTLFNRRHQTAATDYMVGGAVQLDAALREANHGVPVYAFGHSHRAARRFLGAGGPIYANTGTWSRWAPPDEPRLPYLEIDTGFPEPTVTVRYWGNDQQTVGSS